jgi:potassium-dependent mechanosensitive channel
LPLFKAPFGRPYQYERIIIGFFMRMSLPQSIRFSAASMILFLLLLFSAWTVHPSWAQQAPAAQLQKLRDDITQLEREVQASATSDKGLLELRGKLDPVQDALRAFVAEQVPQLEGIKARLEQLGPKADASKGQTDNPEVAKEREGQEKALRDVEGLLALARNHLVSVDQLSSKITDQRRSLLTKALMERSTSVFSPVLWLNVARALPSELRSASGMFGSWFEHVRSRLDIVRIGTLVAAVVLFVVVAIPGNRYLRRFEGRPVLPETVGKDGHATVARPARLKRALAALRVTLMWAIVPIIVCTGLFNLLDSLDLINDRVDNIVRTLLFGIAFVAFAHGLADGILAPDDPQWRLVEVDDKTASRITHLASVFTGVIVIGKTVEALNQAIYAVLPVTVATKAVFALLGALAIARTLRGTQTQPEADEDAPQAAVLGGGTSNAIRVVGWAAAAAIIAAASFGYIALAGFLSDQIIWIAMVGAVLIILLILVDEYIGYGVSPEGTMGKQIVAQVGISKSSLKQISILSNGFFRVVLLLAAAMFVLAPWGLDGGDSASTLRAALFGFTVGGVTISVSTIVTTIVLLVIGFTITRAIRRWLEKSYLPHTKLDVGLRNSIATSIGYLGIIITSMMAASTLGLSLDKLTIVAGALSVGIGFGLQSIVNNFVSGLILLWERPIRVGDWIVVGDEQGIVKRINVRSTQIETFDRASLIVPNAEFISGRVKNWMHNDRIARVIIPIGVGYGSDPERVKEILLNVANSNKEVLKDPVPRVYFMRLADPSMEFELRCFVDVDHMLPVKSALLFELIKQLQMARIDIPMPKRPTELLGIAPAEGPVPDAVDEGRGSRGSSKQ